MIPVLVVPILARPDLLRRMLASIDHPVGRLVVIDNGHCVADLPPMPNVAAVTLLSLPSNLGVATSWNLGIKITPMAPWWLIAGFDVTFAPGSLASMAASARADAVVLSGSDPPWAAFTIGEAVVDRVGLFDEGFHPAFFEDWDYERRCEAAGVQVVRTGTVVDHDNSSTLKAGYHDHNRRTFPANRDYFEDKIARGDLTEGHWTLARRREQSWD